MKKQNSEEPYSNLFNQKSFEKATGIPNSKSYPAKLNAQTGIISTVEDSEVNVINQTEEEKYQSSYSAGMMRAAVDWLVYEPNFLYKEFADQ